jgi:hypothetical protein
MALGRRHDGGDHAAHTEHHPPERNRGELLMRTLLRSLATSRHQLGTLLLVLVAFATTPHRASAAQTAHFTYRTSSCTYAKYADPLNVRWFNIDWLGVKAGLDEYMPGNWGALVEDPFGSSSQYAFNGASCQAANYSSGRQWGPYAYVPLLLRRYKFHARLFTTGSGQVAADAHIERKKTTGTCSNTSIHINDAVYSRYNGESGFDAGMDKIVAAYRAQSSSSISVLKARSPFTHLFKQCTGEIVEWSGRVAYITRPGP